VDTISIRENTPEVPPSEARHKELAVCSGCRVEYREKQLITVHEGHHDNLTFFDGDRVCRKCARVGGVEF